MNNNGFRVRPQGEPSEYQKRIDQIDSVILCLAEAEKLVADLGKSFLTNVAAAVKKTAAAKITKKPAWEGVDCFRMQKRGYTYLVGTFSFDKTTPAGRKRQGG